LRTFDHHNPGEPDCGVKAAITLAARAAATSRLPARSLRRAGGLGQCRLQSRINR